MSRRGIALHLVLTIGAGVIVLALWVGTLPRVRSDMIQIALHHDGRPMRAVPVMLTSDPPGNPRCQSEGLRGRTDSRGQFLWERPLPEQNLLGFGRQVDEIVICAQIGGQQQLLWKRKHLEKKERMNLSCNAASSPAHCVVRYGVTMSQTAYLTVMALLAAMLVRVFWYRKSESVSRAAVAFLLLGIFGSSLLFSFSMIQHTQLLLTGWMLGGLVSLHFALTGIFRRSEAVVWAPEFPKSDSSRP